MRIRLIGHCFTILFILLGGCLFYLQIVKGDFYKNLSDRNSIRLLSINAPRGVMYDRRNEAVARDALSFGIFIVPQEVKNLDVEIRNISKILGLSESLLRRNYKRNYYAPFAPCELIRNISKKKAILIEELRLDMPGVIVKEISSRNYPYKEAFAHVLGYVGEMDRRELELLKSYGYSAKDLIGKDGVERVADSYLHGRNGGMQIQVDNRGRHVKVLNFKKPKKGKDVHLTIDTGLQLFIWNMMKDKAGAAVFMDPYTGEILTLVSSPSYDPNDSLVKVLNDKRSPLLNRAIMGQYPPGSLFKIVVAIAGLESGKIQHDAAFTCHGKLNIGKGRFNCWNRDGHGTMHIEKAIIESCNVYFYNAGILVGVEKIYQYAKQLGFGRKTGIDLFGEAKAFVPSRAWKKTKRKENWYAGDTANLSIGQGYLLVTPLQIARLFSVVANGGRLVEPHVLKKVGDIDVKGHKYINLKIKQENINIIQRALKGVVDDEDGTGFRAWSESVSISGKTGTAQVGAGLRTHAWFAGFSPSEKPEISFVIFLEHGGSGGDDAALIAKKAAEYWHKNK
ncbi:penicillin-binding protein 2 [Candidatus Omnitrophota bacterium]